jgi:hypothetical protein
MFNYLSYLRSSGAMQKFAGQADSDKRHKIASYSIHLFFNLSASHNGLIGRDNDGARTWCYGLLTARPSDRDPIVGRTWQSSGPVWETESSLRKAARTRAVYSSLCHGCKSCIPPLFCWAGMEQYHHHHRPPTDTLSKSSPQPTEMENDKKESNTSYWL